MSSIPFPVATRRTAFIAGASLAVLVVLLGVLKARGTIPYDADSPQLLPFVILYFFVSVLVYVIDVRSLAPKELKTQIPGIYFPTNREGISFMFSVWVRMLLWFLGAASAGIVMALVEAIAR
jgi:cellobiose-specific phosphotransferase system component IIC